MNILTAIMDVEMLYFHTHKQVILKSNNLTISQFEVSYEVLFISFSTTLFQYFSIILEKINIIQIKKLVTVSCTCFNSGSLGGSTKLEPTQMELFNFLWLIWDHYLPLTPTRNDWHPWHP